MIANVSLTVPSSRRSHRLADPGADRESRQFRLGSSRSLHVHPDALHLRVVPKTVRPQVAPEARLLAAAERHPGVVVVVGVNPDRPGLEPARHGGGPPPRPPAPRPRGAA